jgi:hypothetical protein
MFSGLSDGAFRMGFLTRGASPAKRRFLPFVTYPTQTPKYAIVMRLGARKWGSRPIVSAPITAPHFLQPDSAIEVRCRLRPTLCAREVGPAMDTRRSGRMVARVVGLPGW